MSSHNYCLNCGSEMPDSIESKFEKADIPSKPAWYVIDDWLELFFNPLYPKDEEGQFVFICPECMKKLLSFLGTQMMWMGAWKK